MKVQLWRFNKSIGFNRLYNLIPYRVVVVCYTCKCKTELEFYRSYLVPLSRWLLPCHLLTPAGSGPAHTYSGEAPRLEFGKTTTWVCPLSRETHLTLCRTNCTCNGPCSEGNTLSGPFKRQLYESDWLSPMPKGRRVAYATPRRLAPRNSERTSCTSPPTGCVRSAGPMPTQDG